MQLNNPWRWIGAAAGVAMLVVFFVVLYAVSTYRRPSSHFIGIAVSGYDRFTLPPIAFAAEDVADLELPGLAYKNLSRELQTATALRHLRERLRHIAPGDTLILYLSAYATADRFNSETDDGDLQLLCSDFDPESQTGRINFAVLLQELRSCPASLKLILLDASPVAGYAAKGISTQTMRTFLENDLKDINDDPALWVVASDCDETRCVRHWAQRSYFGTAVRNALRGVADEQRFDGRPNRRVSLHELFQYLTVGTPQEGHDPQPPAPVIFLHAGEGPVTDASQVPKDQIVLTIPATESAAEEPSPPTAKTESSAVKAAVKEDPLRKLLIEAWSLHDRIQGDVTAASILRDWSPVDYAPHLWRELEQRLLAFEQEYRAGSAFRTPQMQRELAALVAEMRRFADAPASAPPGDYRELERTGPSVMSRLESAYHRFQTRLDPKGVAALSDDGQRRIMQLEQRFNELVYALPNLSRWRERTRDADGVNKNLDLRLRILHTELEEISKGLVLPGTAPSDQDLASLERSIERANGLRAELEKHLAHRRIVHLAVALDPLHAECLIEQLDTLMLPAPARQEVLLRLYESPPNDYSHVPPKRAGSLTPVGSYDLTRLAGKRLDDLPAETLLDKLRRAGEDRRAGASLVMRSAMIALRLLPARDVYRHQDLAHRVADRYKPLAKAGNPVDISSRPRLKAADVTVETYETDPFELVVTRVGAARPETAHGPGIVLRPLANRKTHFEFSLKNRTPRPRRFKATLFAVPTISAATWPPGRLLASDDRPFAEVRTAALVLQNYVRAGTEIGSTGELPLDRVSRIVFKPKPPAAPAPPETPATGTVPPAAAPVAGADVTLGMVCEIVCLETKQPWIRWIELVPRSPGEFLDATVSYSANDSVEVRIATRASSESRRAALLPPDFATRGVKCVWDVGGAAPENAGRLVRGLLDSRPNSACQLHAAIPPDGRERIVRIMADDYPRAIVSRIAARRDAVGVDLTPAWEEVRIQHVSLADKAYDWPREFVSDSLSLSAPPRRQAAFHGGGGPLELSFEADARDGSFESGDADAEYLEVAASRDLPPQRFYSDRHMMATAQATETGAVAVLAKVGDYQKIPLDTSGYHNQRIDATLRLVRQGREVAADTVSIVFDEQPPAVDRITATFESGTRVTKGAPLPASLTARDLSGVRRVAFVVVPGPAAADPPGEDAAKQGVLAKSVGNFWSAVLQTAALVKGRHALWANAVDEVGLATWSKPLEFEVVDPPPPAEDPKPMPPPKEPTPPRTGKIEGTVMMGDLQPAGIEVKIEGTTIAPVKTDGKGGFVFNDVSLEKKYTLTAKGVIKGRRRDGTVADVEPALPGKPKPVEIEIR